jgi:hypothetical protein
MRFVVRFLLLSSLAAACQATPPSHEPTAPAPTSAEPAEPAPDPNMPVSSPPVEPGVSSDELVWKTMQPKIALPAEWRACSDSSECKLVETACCDHCNGGTAIAVNAKHEPDVQTQYLYPRDKCTNVACTERGCFTRAICESGRCEMQWQSTSHESEG